MGSVSHSCVLSLVRPHTCYVDPLLDIIGRHVRIGMLLFRYKRSSNREADVLTANQISSWPAPQEAEEGTGDAAGIGWDTEPIMGGEANEETLFDALDDHGRRGMVTSQGRGPTTETATGRW